MNRSTGFYRAFFPIFLRMLFFHTVRNRKRYYILIIVPVVINRKKKGKGKETRDVYCYIISFSTDMEMLLYTVISNI